jgi:succinate-semialdehyde dehydrogenase/glutarate-semialdehyde dehydrogenase
MTMELGGHAPFVVFDDAEAELAAADLAARKFTNAGQTCSCPQRIFLQEAIASRFLEALAAKIDAIVVGDGTDPRVTMGPLLSAQAVAKVERHVSDALAKGAKVVRGGKRIDRSPGTLHAPTLLTEASDAMLLAKEETFGPVAAVWRFRDESELMPRLNHPSYGLTGYCYTRDIGRAFRTSKAMRVGFIGLNDRRPQGPEVPLGGVRDSGLGREGGRWGIEGFLTLKYLSLRLPAAP